MLIQKKICMIGNFFVGKTSLIRRYVLNQFSEQYLTTIGVHISKKEISFNENSLKLLIWDLAGEDSFQKIESSYLAGSAGYIIVGDFTRPDTIAHTHKHIDQVTLGKPIPVVIALNKSDLVPDKAEQERIIKAANLKENIPYFITSSKNNTNVEKLFHKLGQMIMEIHLNKNQ